MARSYDLTDEKETQQYLRDVEIEYQFQCLDQKEPDGCHRLAEFRENIRQNVSAAVPLYKENCDKNKYPKSCYKYGQCLLTGKGMPDEKPDYPSALEYYQKSCDLGHASGCCNAAQLLLTDNVGEQKDYKKSVSLFEKACDLKDGESCFKLSGFYLTGVHTPKDLKRAFELATKGCALDHMRACSNLSIMYRHGHGTEKNVGLADKYKQRAINLSHEQIQKQPMVTVNQ